MQRPRVLVVDEEVETLDALRECLEPAGWELEIVLKTEFAPEVIGERQMAVVIVSLDLPESSAFDLLKTMHGVEHTPPIIAMSISSASRLKARAKRHGADSFLLKPVDAAKLLAEMAKLTTPKPEAPPKATPKRARKSTAKKAAPTKAKEETTAKKKTAAKKTVKAKTAARKTAARKTTGKKTAGKSTKKKSTKE